MMSMGQTRRSIAGICLAFSIAACGSGGNGSSGTGGSGKEGGTTGNPTGGTSGSPQGGASGSSNGGTTGNPTAGTSGSPQGGASGSAAGGTAGNPTAGTTGNPTGGTTAGRGGAQAAAERAAAWAAREPAARQPPGPAAGAELGRRHGGRRGKGRRSRGNVGRRRSGRRHGWPTVAHGEWLRGREGMAHGQPAAPRARSRLRPIRWWGLWRATRPIRSTETSNNDSISIARRTLRPAGLPPHPGLGERAHRQSRTESPALCHRLRRQQVVWTIPADDESSRLARFRGDRLAQHHDLQRRPAPHDRRPGLADPAV